MEKIRWTVRFRNGEVLLRVKEQRNIVNTVKRREVHWIGHILRGNCLVTHDRWGGEDKGKHVNSYWLTLKEKLGYRKLKEEAQDLWRTRFGRGCGPFVRQATEWMRAPKEVTPFQTYIYGPGSSVGIATDHGLDGPGSNPGRDEIYRPSRPALGPTQPPVRWVLGPSRR